MTQTNQEVDISMPSNPNEINYTEAEDEAFEQISKRQEQERRMKALDEMVRVSEELGLYNDFDKPIDNPLVKK